MMIAPETTAPATTAAQREAFATDGVVLLRDVLDIEWLSVLREAYDWSVAGHESDEYFSDMCDPHALVPYRYFLDESNIADIIARIWSRSEVWFMYEQVFLRHGPLRRTRWRQDQSATAVDGNDLAVAWFSFEPHDAEHGLEFVRGSHRGPLYNGTAFDPEDPTAPCYADGDLLRMPDVEADRNSFDIVSFDYLPGDVLIFHPKMLHGGGGTTSDDAHRHSVSLRFFGQDAIYATRPGSAGPRFPEVHAELRDGDPFRHARFPQLRPLSGRPPAIPRRPAAGLFPA
ncbi:MAG TPA: phytanoyl-CoA dioxygenase family protein [Pseudonocardiaceae bacterium]|jgi:ectoine hydroxylase-related dioxygenase (phytanoyl-CoA dioxygenase family)|nr:phytanoyl-CoA dioxygenase family protein [Pseudonocardiaceae bacterium]